MDLSKDFDTINQSFLWAKLDAYGFLEHLQNLCQTTYATGSKKTSIMAHLAIGLRL